MLKKKKHLCIAAAAAAMMVLLVNGPSCSEADSDDEMADYLDKLPGRPAITSITALPGPGIHLKIKWRKVSGADGYQVYMKRIGRPGYRRVGTTDELDDTSLITGRFIDGRYRYRYKVRAYSKEDDKIFFGRFSVPREYESVWTDANIARLRDDLIKVGEECGVPEYMVDKDAEGCRDSIVIKPDGKIFHLAHFNCWDDGEDCSPENMSWTALYPQFISYYAPYESTRIALEESLKYAINYYGYCYPWCMNEETGEMDEGIDHFTVYFRKADIGLKGLYFWVMV